MLRWLTLVALLSLDLLHAADYPVAVFTQVFNGYKRTQLPDKSFKPEVYTFGEGGCYTRPVTDAAMKEMTFLRVAQAVAVPLARQNYRPARTSAEAELLILVFWGDTQGSRGYDPANTMDRISSVSVDSSTAQTGAANPDPIQASADRTAAASVDDNVLMQMQLSNRARDHLDDRNARLLGYKDALDGARFASHMGFAQDIKAEVADNRYYVVLQAYDFKTATKEKKLKPLWTARISMDESGNDFARSLDRMLQCATPYLGQDSNGLRRNLTRETRVDLGPLNVIETLPQEPPPKK